MLLSSTSKSMFALLLWFSQDVLAAQTVRTPRQFVGSGSGTVPCPPGFQKLPHLQDRYCYRHFQKLASWTEAWTFCKSINAELLTIADSAENQAVADWLAGIATPDKSLWLSGHNMLGQWTWAQQGRFGAWQPLPYSAWASGQPPASASDGTFQCLLSQNGQWSAASCDSSHAFVCTFE